MLGAQLNTIHNLRYYQNLMSGIRDAIASQSLDAFVDNFYRTQAGKETPQQAIADKSAEPDK